MQAAVYRLVSNFAREGRTNRLILLHGPNGSAKSTFVACMQRAMEHYSTLDEGALYRFNWIFPSQKLTKGGIGFGGGARARRRAETYAYLEDELIEAKIVDEMRDHPLLLVPREKRRELIEQRLARRSRRASDRPTICCAAICRTATARSSRRCCPRTTAIWPRCCATSRSSASSSRAATARRRRRSSRSWRSMRARGS